MLLFALLTVALGACPSLTPKELAQNGVEFATSFSAGGIGAIARDGAFFVTVEGDLYAPVVPAPATGYAEYVKGQELFLSGVNANTPTRQLAIGPHRVHAHADSFSLFLDQASSNIIKQPVYGLWPAQQRQRVRV